MFFIRWQVISLRLWVQIGTADEGKCHAMDAMLLTVGVVLRGGCKCSDTHRTPFPLLVAEGLQWKGKRGQTDYTARREVTRPRHGIILRLTFRARTD